MNNEQLSIIRDILNTPRVLTISDVPDRSSGTLLYGYSRHEHEDLGSITHHLYVYDGRLHFMTYTARKEVLLHLVDEVPVEIMLPRKRAYPESCNFKFAQVLAREGIQVSYTTHDDKRAEKLAGETYHGETHDKIVQPPQHKTKLWHQAHALEREAKVSALRDAGLGDYGDLGHLDKEDELAYYERVQPLREIIRGVEYEKPIEQSALEAFVALETSMLHEYTQRAKILGSIGNAEKLASLKQAFLDIRESAAIAGFVIPQAVASA